MREAEPPTVENASDAASMKPATGQEPISSPTSAQRFPILAFTVVGLMLWFPHMPWVQFSQVGVAIQAAQFVIVTASLVMLTGWVGQISLGHAALVGVGAYATGWAVGGWSLPFPINLLVGGAVAGIAAAILGGVALRVRGLYLAVATLIFSWMADAFLFRIDTFVKHSFIDVAVTGDPAGIPRFDLTNRTTMFYVTWGIAVGVLLMAANVRDSRTGRAFFALRGSEIGAASLGIDVTRYKLLAFTFSGFLAGVSGALITLDSRSLSPDSFAFTVSLFYLALAVVGGLLSLGGAVASSILFAALNELFFRVRALGDALDLVSAILLASVLLLYRGGLAAVPETVRRLVERARSTASARQPELVREVCEQLPKIARRELAASRARITELTGRIGRAPARAIDRALGGLAAIGEKLPGPLGRVLPRGRSEPRPQVSSQAYRIRAPRLVDSEGNPVELTATGEAVVVNPAVDEEDAPEGGDAIGDEEVHRAGAAVRVLLPDERDERLPLLEASRITVRFGGLTAVNEASLSVREHEIVGLIGPNGAGKTTLFNAIAGLNNPTEGTVHLFGRDVTALPVHLRAQLGVARTFQAIQLFPQLSVFDNLLVATHVHNETGFFRHLFAAETSLKAEAEMRHRVAEVIEELRLSDVAYRQASELPFGVLRMVEVARAMVTDFPLIMLDEPASGLDNSETDRLAEMLLEVRAHGVTLLLIEHDVRMVTSVSDYMYVLNRGEIIADGTPVDVQRNDAVIAAYLGEPSGSTDEENFEEVGAT